MRRRLYQSILGFLLLIGLPIFGYHLVCAIHDAPFRRETFSCLDAEVAKSTWQMWQIRTKEHQDWAFATAEKCNARVRAVEWPSSWDILPKDVWMFENYGDSPGQDVFSVGAAVFGPVLALIALRRWLRWLFGPESSTSAAHG